MQSNCGLSGTTGGRTAGLVAHWRQADERLYAIVLVDPERFTQVVSVVRAACDRLARQASVDELVATRHLGRTVVAEAAETVGIHLDRLGDVELVADAAFHLRHRELIAHERRRQVAGAIAAGRARGDTWVVVSESGLQHQPAVQPYERIEMRVDDGRAVRGSVDVDADSFASVYTLERLRLDPQTAAVIERADRTTARTYTDCHQWEAAWTREREQPPR